MAADMPTPLPVKAQSAPPPGPAWTFHFAPYLWAAGLKGDIAVGPAAPTVQVDADFGDILDHMKFAFMGEFEMRYGRFAFITDIAYLAVDVSATGPLGFFNGKLEDKTLFATFAGAYRFVETPNSWVDVLAGARAWWRDDQLTITGPGGQISANRGKSWVDPIVGFRARAYLTPNVFVQLYGDVGGFGVGADLDWQVAGLVGYQYNQTTSFFAGYRYLDINYDKGGYLFDVTLSGPVVGASFRF
jgi:hypothetical protein